MRSCLSFWLPEDTIEKKPEYRSWMVQGFIQQTDGNIIDLEFIRKRVNELSKQYQITDFAFDPYNSRDICTKMAANDGLPMIEFRQGFKSMNEPSKKLEMLVINSNLAHNNHPVLRWMAANVAKKEDAAGNIKPDKDKSTEKIDGIVASVMAIGRWMERDRNPGSVYDTRGIMTL